MSEGERMSGKHIMAAIQGWQCIVIQWACSDRQHVQVTQCMVEGLLVL